MEGDCEGEVMFFSTKCWDRRNRGNVIESVIPLCLTVLASKSQDYTTAPQHSQTPGGGPVEDSSNSSMNAFLLTMLQKMLTLSCWDHSFC